MIATGAAAAGPTRSGAAISAAPTAASLRGATPLKHVSRQSDAGSPALGYALAAVVGAGIIAAVIVGTKNDSKTPPSSPG
jgi:hypothetical protein